MDSPSPPRHHRLAWLALATFGTLLLLPGTRYLLKTQMRMQTLTYSTTTDFSQERARSLSVACPWSSLNIWPPRIDADAKQMVQLVQSGGPQWACCLLHVALRGANLVFARPGRRGRRGDRRQQP